MTDENQNGDVVEEEVPMEEPPVSASSGVGKVLFTGVAGALVGAGAVFMLGMNGYFQKPFVPSKDTCDTYYETMNGSYLCVIYGSADQTKAEHEIVEDLNKNAQLVPKDAPVEE